ncbi:hypothetical protein IKW73_00255 [Candidatus Saccharibacteria bacterium]|nr:hypothetical protein [Candidatus Saccharibacteria bacterium]
MESLFKLVVQDGGIIVPDTGNYTSSAANGDISLIGVILAGICVAVAVGIIALSIIKRKKASTGTVLAVIAGLAIIAPIINNAEYFANAAMKQMNITVSDIITVTIDRSKNESYVVVPVDITLNETTDSGYELYMYGGALTDGTNSIEQVSADGSKIIDGTWGVVAGAESAPAIDDETWNQIGTSSSPKKVSAADGEIAAGTTLRVYYGVAIDDDTPVGTYTTTVGFQLKHDVDLTLGDAFEESGVEKVTVGPDSYYPIQGMTPEICNNTAVIPSTIEAVDIRDNTIYTIGKLADNRCWILGNLALDLTAEGASTNITPENTNADTTSLNSLFGIANRNASLDPEGNLATAGITTWTSGSSYSAPMVLTDFKNTTNPDDSIAELKDSKYGVMYNYCAASAGSYCYNGDAGYDRPNTAIDTVYDICPSGWRMPASSTYHADERPDADEYKTLYAAYGNDATAFRSALNLPFSGLFNFTYASAGSQGSYGNYWSATRYGYINMYLMNVSSSEADPYRNFDRDMGLAVRCIARDGNEPDSTPVDPDPNTTTFEEAYTEANKPKDIPSGKYALSDMSTAICSAVTTGQTARLVDTRDNTVYNVGKLADNRCWLLDNLALDLVEVSLESLQGKTNASDETLSYLKGNSTRNQSTDPNGNYPTAGVSYWGYDNSYTAPLISVSAVDSAYTSDPIYEASDWKYGAYYNYCAASAGSYCCNWGKGTVDATEDICPAGWRMPTGGVGGEFQTLGNAITNTDGTYFDDSEQDHLFRRVTHLSMGGWIYSGSFSFQGSGAYVWSSSYQSGENSMMNILFVDGSYGVGLTNRNNVAFGSAVRCIAK